MFFDSHTWLLSSAVLCCLSTIGAQQQLFEQPSTLTARNLAPTIYNVAGVGAGAGAGAQLPNHAAVQRAPAQIIKATALQEVRDSEELAPFFQQLLKQTMPNWQTEHKQRGQQRQQQQEQEQRQETRGQQQQHFFVELPSQQPQILHGYNGVNVRQQQQQQQQQQLQSTSLPQQQQQQQQQQQPFAQLPIQKQQQQSYTTYLQTSPKIALAPLTAAATTTTTTTTAAIGVAPPIGSLANSFQPTSPQAQNTTLAKEQCELCCDPLAPPNTPCGCCNTKPLLSAAALRATTG
ncbi:hypothetical protein AWZ03_003619 [Drosophila navojoa]|uniref:Uncharacterized protein n=2 Tax=Drosophila navojoa TaxID=7232 RepID=A0A484BMR7_DRONA|nr:hypothetical protein AWZ03_003619 [Drosophila navojoa]